MPQNTHRYSFHLSNNCSPGDALAALEQPDMSAPGAPQANPGTTPNVQLAGNGGKNLITQIVNQGSMTIQNITQTTHTFYPGQVTFSVTPNGSGSTVSVVGTGSGSSPILNDIVGYLYFGAVLINLNIACSGAGG